MGPLGLSQVLMARGVCTTSSINLRETVRKGPCQALPAGEWLLQGKGRQLKMKLDPAHQVEGQGTLCSLLQALGGRAVRRYQHAEAEAQPSAGVSARWTGRTLWHSTCNGSTSPTNLPLGIWKHPGNLLARVQLTLKLTVHHWQRKLRITSQQV